MILRDRSLVRGLLLLGALPLLVAAAVFACTAPHPLSTEPTRPTIPLGLDLYLPVPDSNALTPARVALGRTLFFDSLLSKDRSLSCASCHDPERAFTDGRRVSRGVFGRRGPRNVPTLVNRAYGEAFFWDGRIETLEAQVLQPIQHPKEMGLTLEEAVGRLRGEQRYRRRFRRAFGRPPDSTALARALAGYVRTILSGNAPVDRYRNGARQALSKKARRGLRLFRGKANCAACHVGPSFTDEGFHNTGIAWNAKDSTWQDAGRYAVTGDSAGLGAFKTPTLREVVRTAPYMHDGSLATLEEVVDHYDRGGTPNPHLDAELRPLHLTEAEKAALVAFLRSLSGEVREGLRPVGREVDATLTQR